MDDPLVGRRADAGFRLVADADPGFLVDHEECQSLALEEEE